MVGADAVGLGVGDGVGPSLDDLDDGLGVGAAVVGLAVELGFGVVGLGFGVVGLGFGVAGLGFGVGLVVELGFDVGLAAISASASLKYTKLPRVKLSI